MGRRRFGRVFRGVLYGLLSGLAGTMLAGCGSSQKALTSSAPAAGAKARLAFVRIDDLVVRHPLQQDIGRLKSAERRLNALAGHLPTNDIAVSASASGYVLSPLNSGALGTHAVKSGAAGSRRIRRESARDEFSAEVTGELARYTAERGRRHTSLTEQRRSEMLAIGSRDDADSERAARDSEDAKVRIAIEGFLGRVLRVQARIAVLDGQLDTPPIDVFMAAPGAAEVDKQVAELENYAALDKVESHKPVQERLKIEPPTGISMLVRLKETRTMQVARLAKLEAELDKVKAQGSGASDEAVERIQRERLAEIERKLAALSDEVALQSLIQRENKAMREVLDSDERVAKRFEAEGALANGPAGTSGGASLPILFGARTAQMNRADIEAAVARIQAQQARLERYIRLDIATAIGDAARARNIDVVSIGSGAPLPRSTAGRTDMTAQFETWVLQPGQEAVKKTASVPVRSMESRSGG